MHFGDDDGHLLTDGTCARDLRRAAHRLQRPAVGWREGVPAGIPGAFPAGIPGAFGERPRQA
jgi:hypothetical protein